MSAMFDMHVHTAPDVWQRYGDDRAIAQLYERAGFRGCVIKAHYDNTAGRARAAGAGLRLRVYGALALNQHVGGCNPAAVAAALSMGARVIWMPTTDAHTQQRAGLPRLCATLPGLADTTYAIPPVNPSTEADVRRIVALVAEHDAVLATGHLSAAEAGWLLPVARAGGVRRLVVTHPTYTVPSMSAARAAELAALGAFAEVTAYQLLHQPGCDAARLAELVRAVGYDRIILSSDAGQPDSPSPPQALELLVDALAGQGLDRSALIACASDLPEALVTP
ncbi:MAG: DUF6282 family protein [Solirubrobacteraceae bacterium]